MSKSNSFENAILRHIFNNDPIPNIGDAGGLLPSTLNGNLYLRLCTTAVAVSDSQLGTECTYTGYVQGGIPVPRTTAGWTVVDNVCSNTSVLTFGTCTGNPETINYFEVWVDNTSTTEPYRLFWGTFTASLSVTVGVTPEFDINSVTFNEN